MYTTEKLICQGLEFIHLLKQWYSNRATDSVFTWAKGTYQNFFYLLFCCPAVNSVKGTNLRTWY